MIFSQFTQNGTANASANTPNVRDAKGKKIKKPRPIMGFLFAPQFQRGFANFSRIGAVFVQLLATLFAQYDMLDWDDPALTAQRTSMSELGRIISTAHSRIEPKREHLPRMILFGSIIAFFTMMILTILALGLGLYIGTANAQVTPPATLTPPTIPEGLFNATSQFDVGLKWLNEMFPTILNFTGQQTQGGLQTQIGAMFAVYSNGMLVLASFIILLAIFSIVVDSAHKGKMFGDRHSEVWSPIRLIVGIGLLVPLGNGYNAGQHIVVQLAKMGSGLASNTWNALGDSFIDSTFFVSGPSEAKVENIVKSTFYFEACLAANNDLLKAKGLVPNSVHRVLRYDKPTGLGNPAPPPSYNGINVYYQSAPNTCVNTTTPAGWGSAFVTSRACATRPQLMACGMITFVKPTMREVSLSGSGVNTTGYKALQAVSGATIADEIAKTHRDIWIQILQPEAAALARKVVSASSGTPSAGTGAVNFHRALDTELADGKKMRELKDLYYKATRKGIEDVLNKSRIKDIQKELQAQMRDSGWAGAPAFIFKMLALNETMSQMASAFPTAAPMQFAKRGTSSGVQEEVNKTLRQVQVWINTNDLNDPDVATNNPSAGSSGKSASTSPPTRQELNGFLEGIANEAMKQQSQIFNPTWGINIETTNPLSEVARLGHNCLAWATAIFLTIASLVLGGGILTAIPFVGSAISSLVGAVVGLLGPFLVALIVVGYTLAFLIPLMPAIRFIFGVLAWLASILEALIAMPVFAIAHLRSDGEGWTGPKAEQGYFLILQICLRPVLMTLSLIGSLIMFNIIIGYLNHLYPAIANDLNIYGSGFSGLFSTIALTLVYGFILYSVANSVFKMIDIIPDGILKWIGSSGSVMAGIDDTNAATQVAFGAATTTSNALQGFTSGLKK